MDAYQTQLLGNKDAEISMGPVVFTTGPNGRILAITKSGELDRQLISDALHLLYFSANGHKIYSGLPRDPLCWYFEKNPHFPCPKNDFLFPPDQIDPYLLQALSKALTLKAEGALEPLRIIQAIKYLNESGAGKEESIHPELWKDYLLISTGFEVLFTLNPSFPHADLRQHLRPLLHLKFSNPVELLWKWVDQFYTIRNAILSGEHPTEPLFLENPTVKSPLLLIGEKLLIYAIYDMLFTNQFLEGKNGTLTIPDDFNSIHPERVLVYFWTRETLEKKITILLLEKENIRDLAMLKKIEEMHKTLQESSSKDATREFFS